MKKAASKQNHTIYSAVIKGVVFALMISVIGVLAGAIMLNREMVSEETMGILAFVIWAIAAFTGAMGSSHFAGTESILPVLLANLVYAFLLAGVGILFFESNFGNILGAFLALLAGNIPAVLIIINRKPGKHKRIRYKV